MKRKPPHLVRPPKTATPLTQAPIPTIRVDTPQQAAAAWGYPVQATADLLRIATDLEAFPSWLTQVGMTEPEPNRIVTRGIARLTALLRGADTPTLGACTDADGLEIEGPLDDEAQPPARDIIRLEASPAGAGALKLTWHERDAPHVLGGQTLRTALPTSLAVTVSAPAIDGNLLDDQAALHAMVRSVPYVPVQVSFTPVEPGRKLLCWLEFAASEAPRAWWQAPNHRKKAERSVVAHVSCASLQTISATPRIFKEGGAYCIALAAPLTAEGAEIRIVEGIPANWIGLGEFGDQRVAVLARQPLGAGSVVHCIPIHAVRGLPGAWHSLRDLPLVLETAAS